ncbi:MAG: tripartite ATP-independent transporter DctM subunit [Halioglobus sp.]|jgi:tripartite ATP-independent transporter DctM subunit
MSVSLILLIGCLLALLVLGFPVAWAMLLAMTAWIAWTDQWAFLPLMPERIYQGMDVFVLMSVPLFVLAGELVNTAGITRRLVDLANLLFGWMRGGLAQVNIATSVLFSGITGVALGDVAALGRIFIPEMIKQGYSAPYAAAVTAASAVIGPMIPPSLIAIIYGSISSVSIAGIFLATIVPGLLLSALLMLVVSLQSDKRTLTVEQPDRSMSGVLRVSRSAFLPLLIPVIILTGIIGGAMTPTEAGAVAAFYALVLSAFIYRNLTLKSLAGSFGSSAMFSGQMLIIVGCGAAFSWALGVENVPEQLGATIANLNFGPLGTLLVFNAILLVLGMFIDPTAVIILFGPVLSMAAVMVGIDPLHFAVIAILNLNIGLITPPLGVCLFAAERIAGCGLVPLLRAIVPFLLVQLVVLLLVSAFPTLSLWLPNFVGAG